MSLFIIAIDGPAASGKSTVSRKAAALLGGVHIDSGALYRGLTWQCLRTGFDCRDEAVVLRELRDLQMKFFLDDNSVRFTIDGKDPGAEIRSETVAEQVSAVAAMPRVREWIVERLRGMTDFGSLVMEGRDIGTVVFPDTPFKFYLDADPDERARRRQVDLAGAQSVSNIGRVKTSITRRDALDRGRVTAPLARAADARVIDTTNLSIDEVVALIVGVVRESGQQCVSRPDGTERFYC